MKRDDFIKLLDFEITNIRESLKTSGMNLWAMVIALVGVLGFTASSIGTIGEIQSSQVLSAILLTVVIDSSVRLMVNLIAVITPADRIRSRIIDTSRHSGMATSMKFMLASTAYIGAFSSIIFALPMWAALAASLVYMLKYSAIFLGFVLICKGKKIPLTNKAISNGRRTSILSVFMYSLTIYIICNSGILVIGNEAVKISIGVYMSFVVSSYILSNLKDLSEIEPYLELRRMASLCEEGEIGNLVGKYKNIAEGDHPVEYMRSWYKYEMDLISECIDLALELTKRASDALSSNESERALIKEIIARDLGKMSLKKDHINSIIKKRKRTVKIWIRDIILENYDEEDREKVFSEVNKKIAQLNSMCDNLNELRKKIP